MVVPLVKWTYPGDGRWRDSRGDVAHRRRTCRQVFTKRHLGPNTKERSFLGKLEQLSQEQPPMVLSSFLFCSSVLSQPSTDEFGWRAGCGVRLFLLLFPIMESFFV